MQKALQNLKETFTQKTVRTPDAIDALKQVGVDEKSINGSHNNREGVGPNGQIIRTSIPVGGRNDYLTRYVLSKVRRALRNGGFL